MLCLPSGYLLRAELQKGNGREVKYIRMHKLRYLQYVNLLDHPLITVICSAWSVQSHVLTLATDHYYWAL